MKKNILVVLTILFSGLLFGQKNFTTKSGQIKFYSNTPLEDVEATNNQVYCTLNSSTGKIQFAVLIKGFIFENSLMQKHFNEEEYLYSDKYPKAIFNGQIKNFSATTFKKNGTYNAEVIGNLSLHGITKSISAKGTITVMNSNIELKSNFSIQPTDYKISVPEEISKAISLTVNCKLQ